MSDTDLRPTQSVCISGRAKSVVEQMHLKGTVYFSIGINIGIDIID